jgi:hypothetical protein
MHNDYIKINIRYSLGNCISGTCTLYTNVTTYSTSVMYVVCDYHINIGVPDCHRRMQEDHQYYIGNIGYFGFLSDSVKVDSNKGAYSGKLPVPGTLMLLLHSGEYPCKYENLKFAAN